MGRYLGSNDPGELKQTSFHRRVQQRELSSKKVTKDHVASGCSRLWVGWWVPHGHSVSSIQLRVQHGPFLIFIDPPPQMAAILLLQQMKLPPTWSYQFVSSKDSEWAVETGPPTWVPSAVFSKKTRQAKDSTALSGCVVTLEIHGAPELANESYNKIQCVNVLICSNVLWVPNAKLPWIYSLPIERSLPSKKKPQCFQRKSSSNLLYTDADWKILHEHPSLVNVRYLKCYLKLTRPEKAKREKKHPQLLW